MKVSLLCAWILIYTARVLTLAKEFDPVANLRGYNRFLDSCQSDCAKAKNTCMQVCDAYSGSELDACKAECRDTFKNCISGCPTGNAGGKKKTAKKAAAKKKAAAEKKAAAAKKVTTTKDEDEKAAAEKPKEECKDADCL